MNALLPSDWRASSLVADILRGAWIVGIDYWRTSWNITFAIEEEHPAARAKLVSHPFEFTLHVDELSLLDTRDWESCIAAAPFDIGVNSDRHSALVAFLLFNCVAYRVTDAQVVSRGDLTICFEGGRTLVAAGCLRLSEGEWSISPKYAQDHQGALVCADGGNIYASSAALQFVSPPVAIAT